jgi:hypothetical protein
MLFCLIDRVIQEEGLSVYNIHNIVEKHLSISIYSYCFRGALWPRRQCASACDGGSYAILVNHWMGDQKFIIRELLHASEGTLSRWSRLHLWSLAPTNPHWAWWVMARSPYVLTIRKACTPAVGTVIGWWWWYILVHSIWNNQILSDWMVLEPFNQFN